MDKNTANNRKKTDWKWCKMAYRKKQRGKAMTSEEKRIADGLLFCPGDPELKEIKRKTHNLSVDYNMLHEDETEKRNKIMKEMFRKFGEGSFMQGPIFIHYGKHTTIGKHCFFNFRTTIQDDASVTIGDHCDFGPGLTIVTPLHPMIAKEREVLRAPDGSAKRACYAKPVTIGSNCWFGANVTVCPGVTIGEGCVIGAGSVVTRDIPAHVFAAGVPCRKVREITDQDSVKNSPERLGGYGIFE